MIESFKKNKYGILLMCCSSIFVCVGQLFWKLSSEKGLEYTAIGFIMYAIGALLMITAYHFGSLSVLQPILSLNYTISIFLAAVILHEEITYYKLLGVFIITMGVILISGGDSE